MKRDKPNMTKLVAELAEAVTPGFGELALATDGSNVLSEAAKMIRAQRKVVKAVQRWYGDRNDGRLVEKLESDLVDAVRKYEAENES